MELRLYMERAFFLGLSSGGACLATCGLLLGTFIVSERMALKRSIVSLTLFLSGRLLGYGGWAVLSWLLGNLIFLNPQGLNVFAGADLVLGGWLIYYGISRPLGTSHAICPGPILGSLNPPTISRQIFFRSGILGFLSGLQLCPPFLAAVIDAARTGGLRGSVFFFLLFYLGTGVWFIPFPFIGTLGRFRQVAQVARFCALPLGAYYIYSGLISLTGGNSFHG